METQPLLPNAHSVSLAGTVGASDESHRVSSIIVSAASCYWAKGSIGTSGAKGSSRPRKPMGEQWGPRVPGKPKGAQGRQKGA